MIIDTEKCTAREATKLAARKWFEKKSVRLILSVIGFVVMAVLLNNLETRSSNYSEIEVFILKTSVLAVMIFSAAGLVSNIGEFTMRKFAVSACVSALILGIVYPIYVFLSSVILAELTITVQQAVGYEVLQQFPCVVIALAISLIPVMVSVIRRRKAQA
ncbi:MAG: hypothetical protein K2N06_03735 [Oscillospiraceae bacterium]|nr:hypothetical protein [Oscillospiraceae bacterium]